MEEKKDVMNVGKSGVEESTQGKVTPKGVIWSAGAHLGYCASNLFDKLGLASGNANVAAIIKDSMLWLIGLITSLAKGMFPRQLKKSSPEYVGKWGWLSFVLSGPIMELGTLLFYIAIAKGGVSIAVPAIQCQILWTAIIARIFLKEKFNLQILIGGIVFVIGLILIALGQSMGIAVSDQWFLGMILALVGGVGWAAGTVLWRKGFGHCGTDHWVGISIHYPCAWIVLTLVLVFQNNLGAFGEMFSSFEYLWPFLVSGIFSSLIANNCFMVALKTMPTYLATIIKSSYPILVSVLAWIIFKESLGAVKLIGIVLTIVGLAITSYPTEKKKLAAG